MSKLHGRRSALQMYEMHYGPNMTPMVDVVMVILIFFMASAAILGPEWFLRSTLAQPKSEAAVAEGEPPLVLGLSRGASGEVLARVVRDGREIVPPTSMAELQGALAGLEKGVGVLVKPDADVPYDAVVRAHEACARVGLTRVGVSTGE